MRKPFVCMYLGMHELSVYSIYLIATSAAEMDSTRQTQTGSHGNGLTITQCAVELGKLDIQGSFLMCQNEGH